MEQNGVIQPPAAVLEVLDRLESAGFQAWCVGGCVRDSLLGKRPFDWDIATSAFPQETQACFAGEQIIEIGLSHGTVALVRKTGHPVEITSFRVETGYTDGRHPDSVVFSRCLKDDLSRRDFTVNAMAYHPKRGLVDLFGGKEDLKQKILRCVGEPAERFSEDALRILRCLRFSAQLGFAVEENTRRALWQAKSLLLGLSQERVREELTKLLCGEYAAGVLREYAEIVFEILPQLAPMKGCTQETRFHCYDVWEHTLHAVDHAPKSPELRWAALLHDSGKPAKKTFSPDGVAHFYGHPPESGRLAREILGRLRFANRQKEQIALLVDHHEDRLPMEEKHLKKLLGQYGEEEVTRLFELMEADMSAKAPGIYELRLPDLEASRTLAREILSRGDCLTLKGMALDGKALRDMGVPVGPEIGKILRCLLDEVLEGKLPNEKALLMERARQLMQNRAEDAQ